MAKVNLNEMARWVSQQEGGKKEVNIAQIKEVIKWTLTFLGEEMEMEGLQGTWSVIECIQRTWKRSMKHATNATLRCK